MNKFKIGSIIRIESDKDKLYEIINRFDNAESRRAGYYYLRSKCGRHSFHEHSSYMKLATELEIALYW